MNAHDTSTFDPPRGSRTQWRSARYLAYPVALALCRGSRAPRWESFGERSVVESGNQSNPGVVCSRRSKGEHTVRFVVASGRGNEARGFEVDEVNYDAWLERRWPVDSARAAWEAVEAK
ncbi:hypothetical protein FB45DRAFT_1008224 [Roridomyces roridus]|uniref:Uncharacterized protein n=1 Tax=Roridomyces roridus TaxID=1738132 RepID=A0AAD7BB74_9AGAR|nr:hypothetical protein FB45DRAFT_1008224 [Roridomyces roridus]